MHRVAESSVRPRIMVLAGTRPEALKLAPVVLALRRDRRFVDTVIVSTGQHADLVHRALATFRLAPDRDLRIMRPGQDLFHIGRAALAGLEPVLRELRPDLVLVQGDTASVLFGALSAYFERVALGHVEAGLRTGDKWRPYPEELFRRLTGVLADLHFAPTWAAHDRLVAEGVPADHVFVTGNTSVDAQRLVAGTLTAPSARIASLVPKGSRLVLVTAHRRESFGAPLRGIFAAVRALADRHPDTTVVVPVHPNPVVRAAARTLEGHPRIRATSPLDYEELLYLLQRAALVLTDSGGIQEEAPGVGVPVLVLRDVTERPEGLGTVAELVGTDPGRIERAAGRLLTDEAARLAMARHPNPYGDGMAGARIADVVIHHLTGRPRRTVDWEGIEPRLVLDLVGGDPTMAPGSGRC